MFFFQNALHNIYIFLLYKCDRGDTGLNKTFMAKAISSVTFGPLSIISFLYAAGRTNAGQMFKCGLST